MTGIEEVAAVAALAGAAVSAYSAVQQGEAASAAAKYNAQVQEANAQIAQNAAGAAERQKAYETQQLLGKQRAVAAASGVDPNTGSPLNLLTDTAAKGTLDALNIRYQGTLGGISAQDQATLDRFQGSQAATAGYLRAGSTVLTGASNYIYQTNPGAPSGGAFSGAKASGSSGGSFFSGVAGGG